MVCSCGALCVCVCVFACVCLSIHIHSYVLLFEPLHEFQQKSDILIVFLELIDL